MLRSLHGNVRKLSTELLLNHVLEVWIFLLGQSVFQERKEEFGKFLRILK